MTVQILHIEFDPPRSNTTYRDGEKLSITVVLKNSEQADCPVAVQTLLQSQSAIFAPILRQKRIEVAASPKQTVVKLHEELKVDQKFPTGTYVVQVFVTDALGRVSSAQETFHVETSIPL
jgi:hypothetical protein